MVNGEKRQMGKNFLYFFIVVFIKKFHEVPLNHDLIYFTWLFFSGQFIYLIIHLINIKYSTF